MDGPAVTESRGRERVDEPVVTVRLREREDKRLRSGHLWVFSNEIQGMSGHVEAGDAVRVVDAAGRLVGTGYVNPHSLIAVRLVSRSGVEISRGFIARRIANALSFRERAMPGARARRIVYGEADLLPGLIVDAYGDCVVVQSLTAGIERRLDMVLDAIADVLAPATIVLRNDSPMREYEGLPLEKRVVKGTVTGPIEIEEHGRAFVVDVLDGQKTGFYLDQSENRRETVPLAAGQSVLDCCCYTGAWAVHARAAGATSVTLLDSSGPALDLARRNWSANGLDDSNVEFREADVFKALADLRRAGAGFGLVILDPPSFARSRRHVREALKAYRTLNRLAIAVTRPGGHLVTSKCSHLVESEAFMHALVGAAREAGRHARVRAVRGQSADHPVILGLPETDYLTCVALEII